MKVGDLVHDYGVGQSGIVVDIIISESPYRSSRTYFEILYEDGSIDLSERKDLEVTYESRG